MPIGLYLYQDCSLVILTSTQRGHNSTTVVSDLFNMEILWFRDYSLSIIIDMSDFDEEFYARTADPSVWLQTGRFLGNSANNG